MNGTRQRRSCEMVQPAGCPGGDCSALGEDSSLGKVAAWQLPPELNGHEALQRFLLENQDLKGLTPHPAVHEAGIEPLPHDFRALRNLVLNKVGILSVGDRTRKRKRFSNLILKHLEDTQAETINSKRDLAQWQHIVLEFRREQSAYMREDAAKLITATSDQTDVLHSMLGAAEQLPMQHCGRRSLLSRLP